MTVNARAQVLPQHTLYAQTKMGQMHQHALRLCWKIILL